jgi:hypothetical protein
MTDADNEEGPADTPRSGGSSHSGTGRPAVIP